MCTLQDKIISFQYFKISAVIKKCDTSFFFLTLSAAQQQQDSEQQQLHGVRWYEEKQLTAFILAHGTQSMQNESRASSCTAFQ